MAIKSFEDLEVWQRGHQLTLEIYKITKTFPSEERFGLVSQVRRSAASICANVAEGYRKSTKDFVRYLDIAVGSLEETKYHLILSRDLKYFPIDQFDCLYNEASVISAMLTSLIQKLRLRF